MAGSASLAGGPEQGLHLGASRDFGLEGLVIISNRALGRGAGDVNASRGRTALSPLSYLGGCPV